jgi:hypothetical protein
VSAERRTHPPARAREIVGGLLNDFVAVARAAI